METIKVAVEVSVNLSENTQNFIKSLFTGVPQAVSVTPATTATTAAAVKPVEKPDEAKKPVEPVQTKQNAEPAPSAPATPAASKTIEDVRHLLAKKVNEHRDEIKNKLNELGAPSVTKLNPSKYDEMYEFLNQL